MDEDFLIRKAKKKDVEAIASIFFDETVKPPWNKKIELKNSVDTIKHYFKNKKIILLCKYKKQVVGFVIANKFFHFGKYGVWVDELFVKQEFQKKGIGSALLEEIEKKFKSYNIKSVELASHLDSEAMKFYKKKGFTDGRIVLLKKEL